MKEQIEQCKEQLNVAYNSISCLAYDYTRQKSPEAMKAEALVQEAYSYLAQLDVNKLYEDLK